MVYPCGRAWWMLHLRLRLRLLCGMWHRMFSGEKLAFVIFLSTINRHAVTPGILFCIFWMDDLDPIAGTW